jgi:receptor protein-tyrosine kinase
LLNESKPREQPRVERDTSHASVLDLSVPTAPPIALETVAPGPITPRSHARNDTPFARRRESKQVEIDLARLASMGYLTANTARSRLADEYRVIKRPLLTNALQKSPTRVELGNLIMITSAVPGEGKTFTAINLALSMAMELDTTVLLVDADVARPSVLERLGLPRTKGLMDIVTEPGLDPADVLLRTNIERLSILPAGTHHPRATELLASDGMNRLLEELASRYEDRILVFDAPPLLPSTESRVLATHMGQVVVVVEAERTQRSLLIQALATIESCPVVMTLLNKVASSEVGSYYYGYYGNARP